MKKLSETLSQIKTSDRVKQPRQQFKFSVNHKNQDNNWNNKLLSTVFKGIEAIFEKKLKTVQQRREFGFFYSNLIDRNTYKALVKGVCNSFLEHHFYRTKETIFFSTREYDLQRSLARKVVDLWTTQAKLAGGGTDA